MLPPHEYVNGCIASDGLSDIGSNSLPILNGSDDRRKGCRYRTGSALMCLQSTFLSIPKSEQRSPFAI